MRLAVFGGTFDPPHNGHLALALFARELLQADRLLISVSDNPLKPLRGASDGDRFAMAGLLSSEINRTGSDSEVSGWELQRPRPSYTVDLLRHFRSLHPDASISLVVGEDSYADFHRWKDSREIFRLAEVVVFRRGSSEGNACGGEDGRVRRIEFASPVSSTMVRERIIRGESVRGLVPEQVLQYILSHRLYREAEA
ncbi:nicotinate (nicotinamide) nucleotide adenylyltransferase [Chlorobium sp. N1]|uniref:nicotinate (nicotinamide) nucleotide adenylyltransferase n=1 Tax=Chlorobium sp. N1 TaxID=2491138 RepID=UPI001039593E|nr:nicotinate (nicotinamide) nucleotide adenylyltransferase [Chlorobium sp. N1]TCD48162.1 nicotinate (nicotinamide) nucleotide adenylyltransferase [Chlorobium sp. N1]